MRAKRRVNRLFVYRVRLYAPTLVRRATAEKFVQRFRVPAVYLRSAIWAILPILAVCVLNKLRAFNTREGSTPAASTNLKQKADGCANNVLDFVGHVMNPVRHVGSRD
jgi:hypothetical protein